MCFWGHCLSSWRLFSSMDFKYIASSVFASLLIVSRNFVLLIFSPYKTMRKISQERDMGQLYIIFAAVLIYFLGAYTKKTLVYPSWLLFIVFLANFALTIVFFHITSRLLHRMHNLRSLVFTFSYTLLPTLIWFVTNAILYSILPPPRTLSLLGKAFSIFFVSFSLSLLVWKFILVYLSLRFSTGQTFLRVVYIIVIYLCIFLPYSILLYHFKLFRVPFI